MSCNTNFPDFKKFVDVTCDWSYLYNILEIKFYKDGGVKLMFYTIQ